MSPRRNGGTIKLKDLIDGVESAVLNGDGSIEIEQIEYDSRVIHSPALFFAVSGFRDDGYNYVKSARKKGAVAVVGERESCDDIPVYVRVPNIRQAMADISARFYAYPGMRLKVCGVTGTNGKTTTAILIKKILEARNKQVGLVTSLYYDSGSETFPAERTTPESLDLQRLLFLMKKNHCVNAVIEVSSHALTLHRVDHLDFRVAVFTNISRDHLDFHKTMEAYLAAKTILFKKLSGELSYVVFNLDQPEFRSFLGEITSSFMTYSLSDENADVYCGESELKLSGTIFNLVTPMGNRTVDFKLPGTFNLYNALAAAAGGFASGIDLDNVVQGLEEATPLPGRLEPLDCGQPFGIFIDYAHTPDAIKRLCETVRQLTSGRLLLLFGCGGDRDSGKRPLMGQAAINSADEVIVTSDNPRGEEVAAIIDEIRPGLEGGRFEILPDRREAIAAILRKAGNGDVVLLAGKGAENYQEIAGIKHPFDDRAEAATVLTEMGYRAVETNG